MKNAPDIILRLKESSNMHLLTHHETPREAVSRQGRVVKLTRDDRLHFREQRGYLEKLGNLQTTALDEPVDSWDALRLQGILAIEEHVENTRGSMTEKQADNIAYAGMAGAGSIGAFIETIPKVVPSDDQEFVRTVATDSIRTIMKWSTYSKAADSALTTIVMNPESRPDMEPRELYTELTFNPDYFVLSENPQVVTPNIPKIDAQYGKQIDKHLRGWEIYYGCPYRIHLPQMYTAMTQTAIRSGLL